jgi:hypothetical protein
MKIITLTDIEREEMEFTHKIIVTFADMVTAALTQTLNIFPKTGVLSPTLNTNLAVRGAAVRMITPFTGPAVTSLKVDVGDNITAGRFIALGSTDLLTAFATNATPNVLWQTGYPYSFKNLNADGVTNLTLKFTAVGANLNVLTTGEAHIYICINDLADLDKAK